MEQEVDYIRLLNNLILKLCNTPLETEKIGKDLLNPFGSLESMQPLEL